MATPTIDRTGAPIRTSDREDDLERPAGDVGGQEDQSPIEPIRDDARGHRQDQVRRDPRGPDESEGERIVRLLVDDDEHRDHVEPVADRRDELACHEPRETGVGEDPPVRGQHGVIGT